MTKLVIRTTSQMDEAESINDNDTFEMQQQTLSAYQTMKVTAKTMKQTFEEEISSNIAHTFNLVSQDSSTIVDVLSLSSATSALYNDNVEISGTKTFSQIPKIEALTSDYASNIDKSNATNIYEVEKIIDDRACFIANDYKIDADPGTDASPSFSKDADEFMHWHFDDNTTDSSEWINPSTKSKDYIDGVICQHTGYLTIYGWLADNGQILPQDAWVGLYGQMSVVDTSTGDVNSGKWVLLQVQPWVKGTYASSLQYVGFNIPVKKGLRLKIKTGFAVNGHVGGFQDSRSITYALNQPNSFVGYISRIED